VKAQPLQDCLVLRNYEYHIEAEVRGQPKEPEPCPVVKEK